MRRIFEYRGGTNSAYPLENMYASARLFFILGNR